MKETKLVSVSGGKDSTLLYCLMVEFYGHDFVPVFADTGHEHPVTVNYVKNLHHMAGGPTVIIVKPDFIKRLQKKGIEPTGNTYLDMMLWKGRAPSTKAQFCTEHLKLWPIRFFLWDKYPDSKIISFTGIRAGESKRRARMIPFSWNSFFECDQVLPLLYTTEQEVWDGLESYGVPPNPLYGLGFDRVGCFPCIHARKDELMKLPAWAWERLEWYENKLGRTFFSPGTMPGVHLPSINDVREWSMTTPRIRGNQYDMFRMPSEDAPSCMTGWQECE